MPAVWPVQLNTLHFIILREFHKLWNSSLRNLLLLPPLTNKYPALHPVDGKVSYCYRTHDNFRNECIIVRKVCGLRHCNYYEEKILTEMKVTTQYPLLFLVNLGCRQVGNLKKRKGWGDGMWTVLGQQQQNYVEVSYYLGSSCRFVCGGLHCGQIFITMRRMYWGSTLKLILVELHDKHAVQREVVY